MSAPGVDPAMQPAEDPVVKLVQAQVRAAELLTSKAGASSNAAEAKDFAQAAYAIAQAVALANPTVGTDGTPVERQQDLESLRAQGQIEVARVQGEYAMQLEEKRGENALAVARANAAAKPAAPKSRSVSVQRDETGRASKYNVEEN